jgi:hypothetical protein
LAPTNQQTLQSFFNTQISCDASNTACQNALSVDTIIKASTTLFENATTIDPSAGSGQPIRPVHDGTLITHTMDSTSPFPKSSKPLLLSTVLDEAALTIYGTFTSAVPTSEYDQIVAATFGSTRSATILNSTFYTVPTGSTDDRSLLQTIGTDYIWKCSTWTFAEGWAANGGTAYVGLYTVGATYPGNDAVPYCTQSGVVCHQDDIEIVVRSHFPFPL